MNDIYYMKKVIALAETIKNQALPNPAVAAIIVNKNNIVGMGIHLYSGSDHAEIIAIKQAGDLAQNAVLYINLEPCSHYGRTPPCVNAIIKAKIKRVVIACVDCNPLVSGAGIAKLKEAAIEVEVGILPEDGYRLNRIFFHNIKFRQPFVTIKAGMSLDGKIATKASISKWITSEASRKDAHYLRAEHQAILVGVNTVIKDNPKLLPYLIANIKSPIRIILDRNLRTPLEAELVTDEDQTWIVTMNKDVVKHIPYQNYGVRIICLENLEIDTILNILYEYGICSIMVEGGEGVYSSFIDAGKFNQLVCYISPQLIGSSGAKQLFAGDGFDKLTNNIKLKIMEVKQLDIDIKVTACLLE